MSDHIVSFELGVFEEAGDEIELLPEDREALQEALSKAFEIFSAPGEADPERVFLTFEMLEDVHPYFSDTRISDQIGEVIELLHEVSDERVLSFEDAQRGKGIIQNLDQVFGIPLSRLGMDQIFKETGLHQ